MANRNILDEYLVKLGFSVDTVQYAGFANALRDSSSLVNNQYLKMAKNVLEFQAAATGMFAAVGAAAIGIVDKTAMADQEYRLLALHMFTSLPVARELKVALDALGQPLENVMWDPELAARFHQLVKDQQTLTQQLGPDFEKQMEKIRDVRFEFSRFGVELQYLTMNIVQDLARAFGTNIDGMLEKLHHFNAWFIANIPYFAYVISTKLTPILNDVREVLGATAHLAQDFALTFTNLVASISGDKSIEGTTFSWEHFGTAIDKVASKLKDFVIDIVHAEQIGLHLLNAIADWHSGNYRDMAAEISAAKGLLTPGSQAVIGGVTGSTVGTGIGATVGGVALGPFGVVPGAALGNIIGGGAGAMLGYLANPTGKNKSVDEIKSLVSTLARQAGVPESLALAVAAQESAFRQFDPQGHVLRNKSGAMGVMQLLPDTAAQMNVNPSDTAGNIKGGVQYLRELLKKYKGNEFLALSHYGGRGGAESQEYARQVMAREATINVTVNVQSTADPKKIASETAKAVAQTQKQETQRNLAEFQTPGWSY